jgi:alpha-1,2-mannosyltransferase
MIRIFGHDLALIPTILRELGLLPFIIAAFLILYAALGHFRHKDWLGRRRVLVMGAVLLAAEVLLFAFLTLLSYGLVGPKARPSSSDFMSFYAAGSLAAGHVPEAAYDRTTLYEAEAAAAGPGVPYKYFFYPPVFLLLCRVLAMLPYRGAYIAFEAASLAFYLIAMRAILKVPWKMPLSDWLIPVLAFPAVFWTLGYGQNAFLTAALFGGASLLIDRRPGAAGFLFGTLCYKPHFGLLVPVALAAGRRWTAFAAAALSLAFWIGLSLALFGRATWHAYLVAFFAARGLAQFQMEHFNLAGYITLFSSARLAGAPVALARAVQAVGTGGAAAFVGWVWWRECSLPVRAAALAAATLIAIPFAALYDLMLATIAMAWLVRAGRQGGFLPYEKAVVAGIFLVPLLALHVGIALRIPLGPLPALALTALCAAHERRARPAPAPAG